MTVPGKSGPVSAHLFGDGETVRFKEKRNVVKYCSGVDNCEDETGKMDSILKTVADCNGILALRIGESPSRKLKECGIEIFTTYAGLQNIKRQRQSVAKT